MGRFTANALRLLAGYALIRILTNLEETMSKLDDLADAIADNTDATASAVTLIEGIADELDALELDDSRVSDLTAQLRASTATLSAAVVANTETPADANVPPRTPGDSLPDGILAGADGPHEADGVANEAEGVAEPGEVGDPAFEQTTESDTADDSTTTPEHEDTRQSDDGSSVES